MTNKVSKEDEVPLKVDPLHVEVDSMGHRP